jgi:hypothetical protein
MLRFCATSLTALVIAVLGVTTASASPILDPIVRTRGGGTGSYQISSLPYAFDFGAFPTDPDTLPANTGQGDNCSVGTDVDSGLQMVSCEFQNLAGQAITLLDFQFGIPGDPTGLVFTTQDPDNLWSISNIDAFGAQFAGGGIASGVCTGDIEVFCVGGDFFVDLIGFPEGTNITAVAATDVPEPASLVLLGTGLGLGAALLSRRHRKSAPGHRSKRHHRP